MMDTAEIWLADDARDAWLLGLAALVALAAAVGGPLAARRQRGGAARLIAALPAVLLVAALLACISVVDHARDAVLDLALGRDGSDPYRHRMVAAAAKQLTLLTFGAVAAAAIGPLTAAGAAYGLSRGDDHARTATAFCATVAAVGTVGAIAIATYGHAVVASLIGSGLDRAAAEIAAATGTLREARWWVAAAAAAAPLSALATRGEPARRADLGWLLFGAALLAIGAGAFAATRGHAWDATHPASLAGGFRDAAGRAVDLPAAPPTCGPLPLAPMLVLHGEEVELDGRICTPEEARRDLETVRRNWAILHPGGPPPVALLVVAPDGAPVPALSGHLRAAAAAGFVRPLRVAARAETVTSRVRGPVTVHRACAHPLEIPADPSRLGAPGAGW